MSRFVRPSKYRHVYGTAAKKELCYDNVKVSSNAWDTNLIAANGKYLSVNWQASGGGAFALVPVGLTGKLPDIYPLCRGHTAPVLDTAFSPFDDALVVSGSDDGTIATWRADDSAFELLALSDKEREKAGGLRDLQPTSRIHQAGGAGRKVGQVLFHPTAANVLAAAGGDHVIRLYDIEHGASNANANAKVELTGFTDAIQSLDFDWTGATLVATCRDRKIRTFDTRTGGAPVQCADSHGGIKGARAVWCGRLDRVITTGFSKMSDRQLFLWDALNLSKGPLKSVTLDSSSGTIMPFWSDNNICFLAGKGDGNIRYYEYESDELHYLTEYKSADPQRGMTFIPRRALNASENEIARAIKVTGTTLQPISFYVPRKADSFQADIFPPAPAGVPALSADEFFAGKTKEPNLINLEDSSTIAGQATQPSKVVSAPAPAPAAAAAAAPAAASATPTSRAAESSTSTSNGASASAGAGAGTGSTLSFLKENGSSSSSSSSPSKSTSAADSAPAQRSFSPTKASSASSFSAAPTPAPAAEASSASASEGNDNGAQAQVKELQAQIEALQRTLARKDERLRDLELENEKLKTNAQRVRDALGNM